MTWDQQVPPLDYEKELFDQIAKRRTHRGGFAPPLPDQLLATLPEQATKENATLSLLTQDRQRAGTLAAVVEAGDYALRLNSERGQGGGPVGARSQQSPPGRSPADPPTRRTPSTSSRISAAATSPMAMDGGQPPDAEEQVVRSAGVVGLLTTSVDQPSDWIHAGQALQRVLLVASSHHAAAALHSQPLEIPLLRDFTFIHLSGRAYPQMVLRLGATSEKAVSVQRPVNEVLF